MNDISKFFLGVFLGILGQILTFFQLQGSTKFDWLKNHYWLVVLMGIPISMLFMASVKNLVLSFDGQLWPSRLIGFSIGAIVFTILSWLVFNEPLSTKTIVCLFLAISILMIQLFFK